ncbi:FAD-binding domain-containing protein [Polyplosphaeria fusca]|uniref:FAD-binding domain-containing protein n=1 Tax=Polyplosphaeria fusca TaxID=682080 RepID=A0A9P4UVR3_9PLEO|nr:FAD-binding domain-containing protein [Polyplosphaeria fusca]
MIVIPIAFIAVHAALAPIASAITSLFPYEQSQLTNDTLNGLKDDPRTASLVDLLSFGDGATEPIPSGSCKSFPGDEDWPSESTWKALNVSLKSALIYTTPIAAPCYDSQWGKKDVAKCNEIVGNFTKWPIHQSDPTSIYWPVYQGRTCLARIDTTEADSCMRGGYPEYAVNVSSARHVQLIVNFARNANIRLVIKNTGHCYLGKSTGAGSLGLWMHNLKTVEFLPQYESDGYRGKAFKLGAGVTVVEVYRAAEEHGVSMKGGISPSVGYVGGYLQGGGHTPLSGYWGMAADSVLEYQVVTADGDFVTASETSHADLFWALRGGGGGTYGVVTSAIVRAHPKIDVTVSEFTLGNTTNQTVSREGFFTGLRTYWESFPDYTDAGTYSWFLVFNTNGQLSLKMTFFAPGHTMESFRNLTKPWFDAIKIEGIPFAVPEKAGYYESFLPAYMEAWGRNEFPMGTATSLPGNRLLPKSLWTSAENFNATWNMLRTHIEKGRHFGGYHQAPKNPLKADNAVSSAWRNTQSFFITRSILFLETATTNDIGKSNKNLLEEILGPWRKLAPASIGGGSYLNEAAVDEPKWKEDFYGTQYERLLEIKKKYDQSGLFYATTAVGSDEWEVRDGDQGVSTQNGRLCRV